MDDYDKEMVHKENRVYMAFLFVVVSTHTSSSPARYLDQFVESSGWHLQLLGFVVYSRSQFVYICEFQSFIYHSGFSVLTSK